MTDIEHDAGRVTLSRNETESLCVKAARGAGFSWGMAEEAGFAAGWLAAQGINGAAALLELLTRKSGQLAGSVRPRPTPGHWQSADDSPLCPIHLGAAVMDRAGLDGGPFIHETKVDPVETPLLLLPFLVRAAQLSQSSFRVDGPGGPVAITPDGAFNSQIALGWSDVKVMALTITSTPIVGVQTLPVAPAHLPSLQVATLNGLGALALRTTVPATSASRSGAGSSTADND